MNFVGKFDAKLPSDGSAAHWHVEHPSAHAPADAIIVPDAHLLFGADFKRSGVDLILSNSDRELVVHDYFKGEHRHPLASPDGAHLTGDIVNALTGQVDYAQADGAAAAVAHVIGHVTKLAGSATAIRNGVSIILNQGDNVEKGDVVQSGSDSTVGITFIDGTVFGLSSNARMVLNEMVYDPNGSNNSSLISLVSGTISFVAGETAKHGDMKVDTPVATMGIRGTAVLVEIDFGVPGQNGLPDAKFQVLVEPDGTTGSYILFDKTTLDPIATVNKAGQQVNINQNGISYSQSPLTPELQKLITDVFTQKFTDLNNTNTKTAFDHQTDSIVPLPFQSFKGPDGAIIQTVFIQTNTLGNGPSQTQGPISNKGHVNVAPTVVTSNDGFTELHNVSGSHTPDVAHGTIGFADLNEGDQPTASAAITSFSYQNAQRQEIGQHLTPTEQAAVQAVEVALNVVQDPAGINHGTATWTYSVPDGALDFLGAGETLTLTYLVTVSNNFAQSVLTTTVPVTITITGTNDVPVITSAVPSTIAFDGGTSVPGGDLTAHVATSGTINFADPDLTDTHTVSTPTLTTVTLTSPGGTPVAFVLPPTPQALFGSALSASLATDSTGTGHGTISWNLAELPVWLGDFVPRNDVLTLTYAVTVTDSQGTSDTQDITVTITGTDTPAVVWIATTGTGPAPDGLWSTGANWETGNAPVAGDDVIVITDQLEGLRPTYPVTIDHATAAVANSLSMDNFGGVAPKLINQGTLAIGGAFNIDDHSTNNPVSYTGPELDNSGTLTVGGAFNISDHSTGLSVVGPKLDNASAGLLTVTGAFTLGVDAIVDNAGSITVDGKMEVHGKSALQNSGSVTLAGGGDFDGQSIISNTTTGATIEVSGGTLNVSVDIANAGTIQVDALAALTIGAATVTGGTVTNKGTLTLNGGAVLKDGTLGSSHQINVNGSGNALDNEQVTNTGGIEVMALGALTLDQLTTVSNSGHAITVDGTGTLTLQGESSITGGSLANSGTVDIEGTGATLDGVTVTGSGAINVDGPVPATPTTLVLKDVARVTQGTLTVGSTGILSVAGSATLDHVGVTNQNSIEITAGNVLTLVDGTTVDNSLGTITVDGTGTLTLNAASIDDGIINDHSADSGGNVIAGNIDVTGVTTISNAGLNNGNVTVSKNVTLTLDTDTVTGATFDDTAAGATIAIVGNTRLDDVTISGGTVTNTTITVDTGKTLKLQDGVTVSGGTLSNFGTLDIESSTGVALNGVTVTGSGAIQVDPSQATTTPLVLEGGTKIIGGTLTVGATSGALEVETAAGATLDHVGVTNDRTIEVAAAGVLTLDDGTTVDNSSGTITVDGGGTLTLNDAKISSGTINDSSAGVAGTIDITGASTIDSGAALNKGNVTVESTTLTLDNVKVNGSTITEEFSGSKIQINDKLTLEGGAVIQGATVPGGPNVIGAISNGGTIEIAGPASLLSDKVTNAGAIQVDDGQTLTLSGTEIAGGSINNFDTNGVGTIDIAGASTIDGSATLNKGNVTVESVTLTLDNVTVNGSTITEGSGSSIQVNDKLTLEGGAVIQGATVPGGPNVIGAVSNGGTIEIAGPASLLNDKVTNTGAIQVDDGITLTLSGTEIVGGAINDTSLLGTGGTIDVTGDSAIDGNAVLNNGNVTVESAKLTLDNVRVNGSTITEMFSGGSLQISGTLTLEGGAVIQGATIPGGPNVTGAISNGGTIEIAGLASLFSDKLTNTGTIQVDDNKTLTLSGTEIVGGTINDTSPLGTGGTIDVTGDSTIDGNAVLNSGNVTVESATLTLHDVSVNGSTIEAMNSGSQVNLDNVTITGGTLSTGDLTDHNKGLITVEVTDGANTSVLDGSIHMVSVAGYIQVEAGANLDLIGTIHNSGTIEIDGNSTASLQIDGPVTLNGSGTVVLDSSSDQIVAAPGGGTLNNYETISGAGTIGGGDGSLILHNELGGVIEATGGTLTDHTLTIHTGISFTNDGTLVAGSGGTLLIDDAVTGGGSATINGGTLEIGAGATDAQTITFTGSGTLQLDDLTSFTGTIAGLAAGDIIDFAGTALPAGIATAIWDGSSLAINGKTVGFTINGLPNGDTFGFQSDGHGGYELAVLPQIETAGSSPASGVEGTAIALNFSDALLPDSPNGATLTSFEISGIPDGATVADTHGDSLTVSADGVVTFTQAELTSGIPAGLTITLDSDTTLHLSAIATATDGNGYTYTVATPDESVTVTPAAPLLSGNIAATIEQGGTVTLGAIDQAAFADDTLGDVTITDFGQGFGHFNSGTYDADTGTWTGTSAQFNALSFEADVAGTFDLSISATTVGNSAPTIESFALTVNAPPTVGFTPAGQNSNGAPDTSVSTAENHAVTIDGITVSDPDVGNSLIEVTLAAGHGSLSLTDSTGLDHVITNAGSIELFGTTAAINTALGAGVVYSPGTDFSGADTLTVTANDQVSASLGGPLTGTEQITVNVEPGMPAFASMTLTIAQGATDVLSDTNFSISDPDTSHFLYTVSDVTGGQFEVSNGNSWTPATSFTTAQVGAGQVEFIQDNSATAPNFSIVAHDGVNASATISPTVTFTPTPPVAHDDAISGPSGSGWVLDTDNGHYYREVATFGSFETAVAGAAADGGYLATITGAAEQSFVVNHVIDGFSATWLGGETNNDRPDANTVNASVWSWVTGPEAGTQFSYTNWNPGEPSGGFNATTQWLQIGATGGWNDAPDAGRDGDGLGAGYLEEWGGTPTQIAFLENTGTAVATSVLLANDTDVNGLMLTVTAVGDSNGHSQHGGTVSLNGDVITYTPSTDYSGADSFSYTITDGSQTSIATVSFDVVPGTPTFNSMTLDVAQGGTHVLADTDFNVTDSLTSHFLYTVSGVTGGQFDVSNGTDWTTATSFTTAQVEAGHVEFIQDGSATAPNFSIFAADGANHSAAIAPTVTFEVPHALAPANLIVNGGFETNDFTGWTISGVATPDSVVVGPSEFSFSNDAPHTGSHEALVGSQPEEMTLSQTVATTGGEHYTVDFWVMQDQPPIGSDDFSAIWNGTTLTSLVNVGQQSGYTEYQFDVTGAAGSDSSTLKFSASNAGYWDIDDVSVHQGAPTTVQEMSDTTTAVSGVSVNDTLTVTPPASAIGSVNATAGNGTVGWQFEATNAQLDHLMGLTQSFTVTDGNNSAVSQAVAVSVGGAGNDQFVFHAGVGADTMVNFSTLTAQGAYAGDTIELANFTGIASPSDVLAHLSADAHGNAVVDLGNHDSITFQGLSVAQIQANASHIFHV